MNFYLMRHGDALSPAENPQRPLSADGRRRVAQTARLAVERNVQVSVIYHSGILRAQENAEILAEHIRPAADVAQLSGLLPEDDPAIVKAELDGARDAILLIGHLPHIRRLAGLLINGDPERPVVEFSPAALVCVTRSAAQWKMAWQVVP